jgi:hypothetical protein
MKKLKARDKLLRHILDVAATGKNNVTELMQATCAIPRHARTCFYHKGGHFEHLCVITKNNPHISTCHLLSLTKQVTINRQP